MYKNKSNSVFLSIAPQFLKERSLLTFPVLRPFVILAGLACRLIRSVWSVGEVTLTGEAELLRGEKNYSSASLSTINLTCTGL